MRKQGFLVSLKAIAKQLGISVTTVRPGVERLRRCVAGDPRPG
ncbi:helix-turn-helix domain-containing protein [Klebsiella pneumoniae subsp. pneumoniae]|nr:helix-turn-helix domain-containing protein [Klebsiella pneumoniae subsp. pneumoniae]